MVDKNKDEIGLLKDILALTGLKIYPIEYEEEYSLNHIEELEDDELESISESDLDNFLFALDLLEACNELQILKTKSQGYNISIFDNIN